MLVSVAIMNGGMTPTVLDVAFRFTDVITNREVIPVLEPHLRGVPSASLIHFLGRG
jgi:hypothetical protein